MNETTWRGASAEGVTRDCRRFAASTASVPLARHFITDTLSRIPESALDSIEMMVSELATNCVLHAATEFEICVFHLGDALRVEVTDSGSGVPVPLRPDADRLGGRGLLIVAELSDQWGIIQRPGETGKTVWFTVLPDL